jgi:hypothetical protein
MLALCGRWGKKKLRNIDVLNVPLVVLREDELEKGEG